MVRSSRRTHSGDPPWRSTARCPSALTPPAGISFLRETQATHFRFGGGF